MDGVVYRGWCKAGGEIGKITDANLNLPTQPIRCPKNNCHCNLDIMATKEKPGIKKETARKPGYWNRFVKGMYESKNLLWK
jgi:hypothetical protein